MVERNCEKLYHKMSATTESP